MELAVLSSVASLLSPRSMQHRHKTNFDILSLNMEEGSLLRTFNLFFFYLWIDVIMPCKGVHELVKSRCYF